MKRGALAVAVGVVSVALILGVIALSRASSVQPKRGSASTVPPTDSAAQPEASPSATASSGPALLLPNVRSLPATNLSIEVAGQQRRLRFAASLANVGPGPLLLRPRGRSTCPADQHLAIQVLHEDRNGDGVFQRGRDRERTRRRAGCMLRHPAHNHWHFDAMARYSLRRPGATKALVSRNKVSFCLRDNRRVAGQRVVVRRQYFGRCNRQSHQGISPGWVDLYRANLSGQWLRVPAGVDSDVLCLDLAADPLRRLREADETDNATSVAIRIVGTSVRRVNTDACR